MVLPIRSIAEAIRDQNTHLVDSLPGISAASAEKIIATLRRKIEKFTLLAEEPAPGLPPSDDELKRLATDLLVEMGIRRPEASRAVTKLLGAEPPPTSVEEIVMEYFRQ
jgi:Holliday junction DNA helicase RuvA